MSVAFALYCNTLNVLDLRWAKIYILSNAFSVTNTSQTLCLKCFITNKQPRDQMDTRLCYTAIEWTH